MKPIDHEELERALGFIDADLPRDEWIAVLMGLHGAGEEAAARNWSSGGRTWDERAFDSAWRSFRASGNDHDKVTLATVFHTAKQYGYTPRNTKTVRVKKSSPANVPSVAQSTAAVPAFPAVTPDSAVEDTPFSRFMRGTDASAHPYVIKKHLPAAHLRVVQTWDNRLELAALYVSVSTGAPATVQVIDATGKHKRNWPGYALGDSAWRVRGDGLLAGNETVFIAEGVATAWACSEVVASGAYESFACAGKGNLRAVGEALRHRYPRLSIVVVSDRDAVDVATRAARACAGKVALMPAEVAPGNEKFDAWDLMHERGVAALAAVLDGAVEPEPEARAVDERGGAQVGIAAILDAMRGDEVLVDLLGFDRMRYRVVLLKDRPWLSSLPGWTDNDLANVELRLATQHGMRAPVDAIARACRILAEEHAFHPVCRYFDALKWDGVHRVDSWLVTHCGADDSDYAREVSRVLLLSMVARVCFPGCKCDTMPVLEGRQGVGKSATLAALGGEFYSDTAPDLDSPRGTGEALRGTWLLENSEITALKRHEVEAQKAFLSRQVDSYRPAYGREVVDQPRQCVVVGTTNRTEGYLADDSGNRRFLPIHVGRCDVDAVIRDRDQFFAEASARIAGGEHWWIEDGVLLAAAAQEAEERVAENPWLERVREYVQRPVAPQALLIPAIFETLTEHAYENRNLMDGRQIAAALRELGYVRRMRGGTRFYVKDGALGGALSGT